MIDIVTSLREDAETNQSARQSLLNAAVEIERLRATIAELRSVAGAVSLDGPTFRDLKKIQEPFNDQFERLTGCPIDGTRKWK